MQLGVNLSFAVKRLPAGHQWAKFVRETLDVDIVQFTFDLIDPWTPPELRQSLAASTRKAADDYGITIHSAFTGLANYTYNGMLHPDEAGRKAARLWWAHAIDLAGELGAAGIGGQLGGLSVEDYKTPAAAEERFEEAFNAWTELSQRAADTGLSTMYIEPTPLEREYPYTVEVAEQMIARWKGATAVPVQYAFDIGHAIYKPLYGDDVTVEPWLVRLGQDIGLIHVQNTDGMSDSHWGWPHPDGTFDVAAFGDQLRQHNLDDRPVFIEVFYPFELADDAVFDNIRTSVEYCKSTLKL